MLGATFLPIVGMVVYTWALYALHIVGSIPAKIDLLVLSVLLTLGVLVLSFGPWTRPTKLMITLAYVPVMLVVLTFAAFATSNTMGDSL